MKTLLIILSFCILAGCSSLNKLPASKLSLAGTRWDYTDDDGDHYEITFNDNGNTRSTNPNDYTYDNDHWSQQGRKIDFEFNDGYSKYHGKMKSLDLISGKAKSVKGKWKWQLRRIN